MNTTFHITYNIIVHSCEYYELYRYRLKALIEQRPKIKVLNISEVRGCHTHDHRL